MAGVMVACGGNDKKDEKKADEKAKQEQTQQDDKKADDKTEPQVDKQGAVSPEIATALKYMEKLQNVEDEAEAEAILMDLMNWYEGLSAEDQKAVDDYMDNLEY